MFTVYCAHERVEAHDGGEVRGAGAGEEATRPRDARIPDRQFLAGGCGSLDVSAHGGAASPDAGVRPNGCGDRRF